MTVKNLIQQLQKWNPNAEVRIGRYGGPIDLSIKGITVYILSPSENQDYVYLSCEKINYEREIIQRTITVEKTITAKNGQTPILSGESQKN